MVTVASTYASQPMPALASLNGAIRQRTRTYCGFGDERLLEFGIQNMDVVQPSAITGASSKHDELFAHYRTRMCKPTAGNRPWICTSEKVL